MSEWWTYRPSDFLLFAPRTYYRLIELYNVEWWPLHLAVLRTLQLICEAGKKANIPVSMCGEMAG